LSQEGVLAISETHFDDSIRNDEITICGYLAWLVQDKNRHGVVLL
jgi:hypothetical protein